MRITLPLLSLILLLSACAGPSAQSRTDYALSMQYFQGLGVERSDEKGLELLRKSADAGNPDAQLMLGFLMMKGENGAPLDEKEGMKFFIAAAKQGIRDAQYNAGLGYVRGQGVEVDYEEALHWFTEAALQGDSGAQYNLGVMYVNGEGTVKNALTAYAWFSIADENNYEGAKEGVAAARRAMTSDEAADVSDVIAKLKKRIVIPPAVPPIQVNTSPNQPL